MWIQAVRDPNNAWLEMQYYVTREAIDWIIKDWPTQWKMSIEKPTTNPAAKQSTNPKGQAEADPLAKTNNPVDNTRKASTRTQKEMKYFI
jgi:hypothetical protein